MMRELTPKQAAIVILAVASALTVKDLISDKSPNTIVFDFKKKSKISDTDIKIKKSNLAVAVKGEDYAALMETGNVPYIAINDLFEEMSEKTKQFIIAQKKNRVLYADFLKKYDGDEAGAEAACDVLTGKLLDYTPEQRLECLTEMWFGTRPMTFEPTSGIMKERFEMCKYEIENQ